VKTIGTYVMLPVAGLYVAGLLDPVLASNGISMGRINFSFLAIARSDRGLYPVLAQPLVC
jgi:hypothetical protein